MPITISKKSRETIMLMLEDGANNGKVSLNFPGITRAQIDYMRAEIDKGTEQTKRKLKRDPLLSIYRSGDIEIHELYAAEYIRYAFRLITADVGIRSMKFEGFVDVFGGAPTENESELKTRIQHQYADWFDQCTEKQIKTGPIIHVLTEAVTLKETDRYYGFRNGRTKKYLVKGLKLYVDMFKPRAGLEF